MKKLDLTILIPCLNEEKTIEICIKKAKDFLDKNEINGEILIADNGSTDKSRQIAKNLEVRVEKIEPKGYGSALIKGTKLANGKYIIMGDADNSYNFSEILPMYQKLLEGYDLVMGNRYKGKMEKGAMKFSHQYIGTPIISFIANKRYKMNIEDFNCGLRGYKKERIESLNCQCLGMEYASEMIIKSKEKNLKITQIPINFYKDDREGKSHLRTIQDGIRHLKVILAKNK